MKSHAFLLPLAVFDDADDDDDDDGSADADDNDDGGVVDDNDDDDDDDDDDEGEDDDDGVSQSAIACNSRLSASVTCTHLLLVSRQCVNAFVNELLLNMLPITNAPDDKRRHTDATVTAARKRFNCHAYCNG